MERFLMNVIFLAYFGMAIWTWFLIPGGRIFLGWSNNRLIFDHCLTAGWGSRTDKGCLGRCWGQGVCPISQGLATAPEAVPGISRWMGGQENRNNSWTEHMPVLIRSGLARQRQKLESGICFLVWFQPTTVLVLKKCPQTSKVFCFWTKGK